MDVEREKLWEKQTLINIPSRFIKVWWALLRLTHICFWLIEDVQKLKAHHRGESNYSWTETGRSSKKLSIRRWHFLLYICKYKGESYYHGRCLKYWRNLSSNVHFIRFWCFWRIRKRDETDEDRYFRDAWCQDRSIHYHSLSYKKLLLFYPGFSGQKEILSNNILTIWNTILSSIIWKDAFFIEKWRQSSSQGPCFSR